MKKIMPLFLIILAFSGCLSFLDINKNKENISKKFMEEAYYGKKFDVFNMPKIALNSMKETYNEEISKNTSLGEDEKGALSKEIENIRFEEKKFLDIHLNTPQPVSDKYLDLKIYEYNWIIEAEKPISRENYSEDHFPMLLSVEFPNGEFMEYYITD